MSVIIVLLIASLMVSAIFLGAFIWSLRNKQFDDEFSPPRRILFDDAPAPLTNDGTRDLSNPKIKSLNK
jgi:cbb3-type cytochrome oxidase maturation protein